LRPTVSKVQAARLDCLDRVKALLEERLSKAGLTQDMAGVLRLME